MKKIFFAMVCFISSIITQNIPRGNLSGTAKDFDSKMALIGVNKYVADQNICAVSNATG